MIQLFAAEIPAEYRYQQVDYRYRNENTFVTLWYEPIAYEMSRPIVTISKTQQNSIISPEINNFILQEPQIPTFIVPFDAIPNIMCNYPTIRTTLGSPGHNVLLTIKEDSLKPGVPYNPSRHAQAHLRFLNNQLQHLSKYPGAQEVIALRSKAIAIEVQQAVSLLRQATQSMVNKNYVDIASIVESLLKLHNLIISVPEVNKLLQETLSSIDKILWNAQDHSCLILIMPETAQALQHCVNRFEHNVKVWANNEIQFYEQCAFDTEQLLSKYFSQEINTIANPSEESWGIIKHAQQCENWNFLKEKNQLPPSDITKKIIHSLVMRNLQQIQSYCSQGNFEIAHDIAKHYKARDLNHVAAHCLYKKYFLQKYTPEGFHKSLEGSTDPLFIAAKSKFYSQEKNKEGLVAPHALNEQLLMRKNHYEAIIQLMGITTSNKEIDRILYELIDQNCNNWKDLNEYITSLDLYIDHSNAELAQACTAFYDKGIVKGLSPELTKMFSMPAHIDTKKYAFERQLLNTLLQECYANPQSHEEIQKITNTLAIGLSDHQCAPLYCKLAHLQTKAFLEKNTLPPLADYSCALASNSQQEIQYKALTFIVNNIEKNDEHIQHYVSRIDKAYQAMLNGDIRGHYYLDKALGTRENLIVLNHHFDAEMEHFAGINQNAIAAHVQEYKNTTTVLLKNGAEIELRHYQFPESIKNFLESHGINPKDYQKLCGSKLQHIIHSNLLTQITKQKDLSSIQILDLAHMQDLLHTSTQLTDICRKHNTAGNIIQATALSNFCEQILHYIETSNQYILDTFTGICEGVVQGAENFVHTITHPKELLEIPKNAFRLLVMLQDLEDRHNQISIFKPHEENLAIEQRLREDYAHVFDEFDRILDKCCKQITWNDIVREGTAFAVETALMNKTFSTVAKAGKIAGTQVAKIAQEAKILAQERKARALGKLENIFQPEKIATTIEGMEITATNAIENQLFHEAQQENKLVKEPSKSIKTTSVIIPAIKEREVAKLAETRELFKFTKTVAQHQGEPHRMIPIKILEEIITNPTAITNDPRGTNALMYYGQMYKNGTLYNVEILYDKANNLILHFLYGQKAMGPLPRLK